MSRPSQNSREVPPLEALWRGLSDQGIADLQDALDYFDGTYNGLMARLKALGATTTIYAAVNGTIAQLMGKSRSDVDLWSIDELSDWGDGYRDTIMAMDLYTEISEELAKLAVWRGFGDGRNS